MIEVLEAFTTFFNDPASGPLANDFTGGLHLLTTPPGDLTNYCVMTPIDAPNTPSYGRGSLYTEPQIQFAVWAVKAKPAADLCRKLVRKLDTIDIPLGEGRQLTTAMRMNDPLPMPGSGERDEQGREFFGWYVTMLFAVSTLQE